jgi:orotate phosphoribosyltransferase-like protein
MTEDTDWRDAADRLADHGVPYKRAEVVALVDAGFTHAEIVDELDMSSRGAVSNQVKRYRENRANAEWIVAEGPEI